MALVGSGEFLDVMIDIDRELLAGRPLRAVFLPTASAEEGPDRVKYWIDLGTEHFTRLGVEPVALPVLTRDDAENDDLAGLVAGAGLVYLSGGNPGYLAETLRGTAVWEAIVASWRGGAALAGCSAGACALTFVAEDVRAIRAGRIARTPGTPAESVPTGLAVIGSLAVIPHFDRMLHWAPGLLDEYSKRVPPGVTIVGVDEDTALISYGTASYKVGGRQSVWVINSDGTRTEYGPGATFDLPSW